MEETIKKAPEAKHRPPKHPWSVKRQVIEKTGMSPVFIYNLHDADGVWFGALRTDSDGVGIAAASLIVGRSSSICKVQKFNATAHAVAYAATELLKKVWQEQKSLPKEWDGIRTAVVKWRGFGNSDNKSSLPDQQP